MTLTLLLPAFLFFLSLPSSAAFRAYPDGTVQTGAVKTSAAYSKDVLNRVYDAVQEEFPDKFDEVHEGAAVLQQKMEEAIFQGKIADSKKALFFLQNKFSAADWKIRAAALRLTPYFLNDASLEGEDGNLTARQIFHAVLDRYSPGSPEGHPFCLSAAVEVSLKLLSLRDFTQDLIAKSLDSLQALAVAPKSNSFVAKAAFNAQAEILSQYQAPETSALKTLESVREIFREEIETESVKGFGQAFTLPAAVNAAEAVIVHYPLPEETAADALYDFLNVDQELTAPNKAAGTALVRLLPRLSPAGQTALAVRVIDKIERNKDSMTDSFRIAALGIASRLVTNIDLPAETARKAAFFLAESFRSNNPLVQKIVLRPLFGFIAFRGTRKNSNENGSSLVATERNGAQAALMPSRRKKPPKRLDNLLSLEEKSAVLKPIFERSLESNEEIDEKEDEIIMNLSLEFIRSALWNAESDVQIFLLQEIETALSAGALPEKSFKILKHYINVARKSGLPINLETAALVVEHAVNPFYQLGRHFILFVKYKIRPFLSENDQQSLDFIINKNWKERKAWQDLIDRYGGRGLAHKERMDVFFKILDRLPEDEEPNPRELLALDEPLFHVVQKHPKKKRRRAPALTQEKAAGAEAAALQVAPLEAAPLQDSACLAAVRSGGD